MPGRLTPLVNDEFYHVYNRGINRQPTFVSKREYRRALYTINFYRFLNPSTSLSKFLRMEADKQTDFLKALRQSKKLIGVFSYCLMPNHFHFLLKQKEDKGISKFFSNFQNSYTKYFNFSHKRDGSLFLDQFKAIRIETDEQLIHLSRYIHLNPYTGYIVKSLRALEEYPWSSFYDYCEATSPGYLQAENQFVDTELVLGFFESRQKYKEFVFDQADYQRKLKEIEHLSLD